MAGSGLSWGTCPEQLSSGFKTLKGLMKEGDKSGDEAAVPPVAQRCGAGQLCLTVLGVPLRGWGAGGRSLRAAPPPLPSSPASFSLSAAGFRPSPRAEAAGGAHHPLGRVLVRRDGERVALRCPPLRPWHGPPLPHPSASPLPRSLSPPPAGVPRRPLRPRPALGKPRAAPAGPVLCLRV